MSEYTHERLLFDSRENHPWFGWRAKTEHLISRGSAVRIDIPASQAAGELYVTPEKCANATDQRMCVGYAPETIPANNEGFISAGGNCTFLRMHGTLTTWTTRWLVMSTSKAGAFECSASTMTPPLDGVVCGIVMTERSAPSHGEPAPGHGLIWPMRV